MAQAPNGKYASGQSRPPKNLRLAMKTPVMLSPKQCDIFDQLVEDNGGYPFGTPAAREAFQEMFVNTGRAWERKENE